MEIDDDTIAYFVEQRRHFEDLRQVVAQLAGILVLAASGGQRAAVPDHPMLEAAAGVLAHAIDGVRRARPFARARRHHDHLVQASAALVAALSESRRRFGRSRTVDEILRPCRAEDKEIRSEASA